MRPGRPADAAVVAALATQVFLDTYATEGIRPDLAREVFQGYSEQAFAARLADRDRRFLLRERGDALIAFAELDLSQPTRTELVRLYVQPSSQRAGSGRLLLQAAERLAKEHSDALWLTVWQGNANALAFYRAMGYADTGGTTYTFEGRTYPNRIFSKSLR